MLGRRTTRLVITLGVAALIIAGMVAFGGPRRPPVNAGLAAHDNTIGAGLASQPPRETFVARDGAALSFRRYPGAPGGGVAVLVHGSSGSNSAVHALAQKLAAVGITAVAIDVRGHGASGPHGDIAYLGQLDDDIADLARLLDREFPQERRLLIGHSSGGGFILRIAGGSHGCAFGGYIALSPYLNYRSTGNRPDAGWASPGTTRIIGLSILDRLGLTAFDGLPVLDFAMPADLPNRTSWYSWRLMRNFGLDLNGWENEIRAIDRPTRVIIGADDELFFADQYPATFARLQPRIGVTILPGVDHMGMVIDPRALDAIAAAAHDMITARSSAARCTS